MCSSDLNARLEARGGFARDVVLEFVKQVADGELGGESNSTMPMLEQLSMNAAT